jgi:hypothetical protein
MSTTLYIADGLAVDTATERTLASNGRSGDHRVTLCAAKDLSGEASYYYLRTNGDPVALSDTVEGAFYFARSLGLPASEVRAAIEADAVADEDSREWAVGMLREVEPLEAALDATPHEVEQVWRGFRVRALDEADEERGGWVSIEQSEDGALYELASYLTRRPARA